MLDSSLEIKQRVKEAIDIVDLVGSYVQLRREGRGYKALCPWHDDSRPSLQINPERQSFKCWVCNIGGDAFAFTMQMEGVAFPEALRMLADRAGISLERAGGARSGGSDEKRALYQAMEWATQRFHRCLREAPDAEPARQYLSKRGITAESLQQFQLGYAPEGWDWLLTQARGTSFTPSQLERIGLLARRQNGPGHYDRFRGRVLFPIFDLQHRAIGIGGRILPGSKDENAAKYINSPETPLFAKSKLLYGLNAAREAIRKSNTALVMEGYTDCIVAHQCGYANAVAVLGTALGADHIQLLRRFAERLRIVSVLDGDAAGRKRANEILQLFVAAGADLRVLTLPDELDPCDFLLERGGDAFGALVEQARDALDHAFHTQTEGIDLRRDIHAATESLEQLISTIARAPRLGAHTETEDRLRQEKFLQRLAFEFELPEEQLRERLAELRRKSGNVRTPSRANSPSPLERLSLDPLERELFTLLLQFSSVCEQIATSVTADDLPSQAAKLLYEKCMHLHASGCNLDFDRLLLEFDDLQVKTLLVELDAQAQALGSAEIETRLADILNGFRRRRDAHALRSQTAALKTNQLEEDEALSILLRIQQQERNRQGISGPMEG
jgi:DNA primase